MTNNIKTQTHKTTTKLNNNLIDHTNSGSKKKKKLNRGVCFFVWMNNIFTSVLLREGGERVRPRFVSSCSPARFSLLLSDLVAREPLLGKGVLLGFSSCGDLLFLRRCGRLLVLDVLLVSPANIQARASFEIGTLDETSELHEMGCAVFEHDELFCSVLTKAASPLMQVALFSLSSPHSSLATFSATQQPMVEMSGNRVYLCVGSDIHVLFNAAVQQVGDESVFSRRAAVLFGGDGDECRHLWISLEESIAIEEIAGRVAVNLRSSIGYEAATLEDFDTAIMPCDGTGDFRFCVTLRLRVAGVAEGRFVWVKAKTRPGGPVIIEEAKAVRVHCQGPSVDLAGLSASLLKKALGCDPRLLTATRLSGEFAANQLVSSNILTHEYYPVQIKLS